MIKIFKILAEIVALLLTLLNNFFWICIENELVLFYCAIINMTICWEIN
jgi:hypothetical protein